MESEFKTLNKSIRTPKRLTTRWMDGRKKARNITTILRRLHQLTLNKCSSDKEAAYFAVTTFNI